MQEGPVGVAAGGDGERPLRRLRALSGHLTGLAVSVAFFLSMGGSRLLRSLLWQGRTTGQVMVSTEGGPGLLITRLAQHCDTVFFYQADGETLTTRARLLSPCLSAQTPVEIAFNPSDPAQAVPVISTAQEWFYLSLGILVVVVSLYYTIVSQVRRRQNIARADAVLNPAVDTLSFVRSAVATMDDDARRTTLPTPTATPGAAPL